MAIWKQGGFFQELAEREQHLQWYPKAFVPAVKGKDDVYVIGITCNACGKCDFCLAQKKCKEPCPPPPPPPPPKPVEKPAPCPPCPPPACSCCHCHCC